MTTEKHTLADLLVRIQDRPYEVIQINPAAKKEAA